MKTEITLDIELKNAVTEFLQKGRKIEAVAIVQERLKLGLKRSKDLVDDLETSLSNR